ncbi:MAG TPA: hypothetical protein VMC41_01980 [Candidatus Nanoarchaeia archaeon]|nr:hypothetical protein [Candidatus Nanoarchaeia archaeon]
MKHLSNRVRGRQILNTVGSAGTALLMTILILNSIILISLAAAKLIFSGVTESNTQARSTKAYFAAEAGAERILYEYRQTHKCGKPFSALGSCHFTGTLPAGGAYDVDWKSGDDYRYDTLTFVSVGNYSALGRSIQLDFDY